MSTALPPTSLSLLGRLRDDSDAEAWGEAVRLYTPLLQSWFAAANLQPADRDDLTQRALVVLVRRLAAFEHNGQAGAFRAWLRSVAANLVRDFRRRDRRAAGDSALDRVADTAADTTARSDADHDRHTLAELLAAVRPEFAATTWEAFTRLSLDGVPARQAAAELGLTVNAVLIAKSRVLARLRREAAAG